MKTISVLVCTFAVLTANAQPPPAEGSLESQLASQLGKAGSRSSEAVKPNEIMQGHLIYSGIAVQLVKTRKPLQLINPLAAPEYGSPEDNLMRDPIRGLPENNIMDAPLKGEAAGWKLFSIRF